jgi:hypothetical protein
MPRRSTIAIAALAGALAFVFADQVRDPGFAPGHRGWVSSHTLAIAQKAKAANGFVGYAVSLATPERRDLYYFDRYPVPFSVALHALLRSTDPDAAAGIAAARQAMNAVYALTVLVAVALLVELGLAVDAAVAAAALAAASSVMVEYRDMVHFDQPALLGMVVLLWSIAAAARGRGAPRVLLATVMAVSAGRGYASLPLLGFWWILDALRARGSLAVRLRSLGTGLPARACWLGAAVAAACLLHNVRIEAHLRDLPWKETGILASAGRRLAADPEFNAKKSKRLDAARIAAMQRDNLVRAVVPWTGSTPLRTSPDTRSALALLVAAVALVFALRFAPGDRLPWILTAAAGPLWLLLMRNLAAFHPYTAVYLFPTVLVFFAALLFAFPPGPRFVAALASVALLATCTGARNDDLARERPRSMRDSEDMQAVRKALAPGEAVAIEGRAMRGTPFALGYYLPDNDIQVQGKTRLLLTRRRHAQGENLTPENYGLFLVRTAASVRARSPLARFLPGSLAADRRENRSLRRIRLSR